ncbi:hypothetical protein C7420_101681 [Pantoea ananatis]|uniref:hypothetical protein n=1 Tax=Pantoea ananas TaxID=553 RepID=UPI000DC58813|nr:hypothetical protein C7420_101681 [Pantoea ananatis]
MKERPILLNAEMVSAVLDGRKTQARRMLTPRQLKMIDAAASIGECYPLESGHQHENSQSYYREWCPFGAVGDRLWVRETWARYNIDQDSHDIAYRATTPNDWPKEGRWRPSIHMPRWASRITLEITGVRVERLQDISRADAIAEGGPQSHPSIDAVSQDYGFPDFSRSWFGQTWWSIYGEESWHANPWVWVIEFKRVEGQ